MRCSCGWEATCWQASRPALGLKHLFESGSRLTSKCTSVTCTLHKHMYLLSSWYQPTTCKNELLSLTYDWPVIVLEVRASSGLDPLLPSDLRLLEQILKENIVFDNVISPFSFSSNIIQIALLNNNYRAITSKSTQEQHCTWSKIIPGKTSWRVSR